MLSSVELQEGGETPVVVVRGDADVNAAPAVDAAIAGAATSHIRVIVDLNEVSLIDSRTIGVLARWVGELRARGGDLPIVCGTEDVIRLFRTIGLEQSFEFFPTRVAAGAVRDSRG